VWVARGLCAIRITGDTERAGSSVPDRPVCSRTTRVRGHSLKKARRIITASAKKNHTHTPEEATSGRFGSLADILKGLRDVRFAPESGNQLTELRCLLCAKSGLMHCNKVGEIQGKEIWHIDFARKRPEVDCLYQSAGPALGG
jgi:hypothetical protein